MSIVETLKNLVQKTMETSSSQDWEHVERVYNLSYLISQQEEADIDLCQVGALLHDIGKVIGEPHNLTGRGRAKVLLRGMRYPSQRIERVLKIIENHSMDNWGLLGSLEEKVVWDADKLDRIGAIGLTRAFYRKGQARMDLHDLSVYKKYVQMSLERLNTKTAKDMAKKRMEFMIYFFDTLEKEFILTRNL